MAEQIPFNIIADVLTKLGSSTVQKIGSACGVTKELAKLTNKLNTINGVLLDAKEKPEISHGVNYWVRRLEDVVHHTNDLLDDFETLQLQRGGVARQVSDFFSSSNQLVFRFKMSNRVKNIKEEVDAIVKVFNRLELFQENIVHRDVEFSRRETHSYVLTSEIVGREENKEEIVNSLLSSGYEEILSMVAIVGIGGLGKTTLAQLVYNDPRVGEYFELKIWVCVSDHFDVKLLVKNILRSIIKEDVESLTLDALKDCLHANIRQKRCLLVLDDVWNEDFEKWDQLRTLLMVVGKGSKIVVTTQNDRVALIMKIDSRVSLEGLEENQSWHLFSKIAFREGQEKVYPELLKIGKEIVNMCNGVPLVIKTVAAILSSKIEVIEWLCIKDNFEKLFSLGAENNKVLSVSKLSYDKVDSQRPTPISNICLSSSKKAEQIPFNIIADVLTKLGSSTIQQIGSAFGVATEFTKLTQKLYTIKGVLIDAEEKQEKSHEVKAWVRRLKDVVYDADDLLDDFATHLLQRGGVAKKVSDFFSSSNQVVFPFKMSDRLKDIEEEVDEIVEEIPPMLNLNLGNVTDHREAESSSRDTHSFVLTSDIVGREETKRVVIEKLLHPNNEENLSVVAIIGMGGLGKTTLAKLVCNDENVQQHFDMNIWVCVSVDFNERSLVKKILQSVSNEHVEGLDLFDWKDKLQEKLNRKRYLLVLDDVWDVNRGQWVELRSLLIVGSEGSRILVTTRDREVARNMGDHSPLDLKPLKEDESWNLFWKIAFREEEKMKPDLTNIGKKIVNSCDGVPLAIKTLGTALRHTRQEKDWLAILNNNDFAENDVLAPLKLSYNYLPTHLKQCFTYCALFPKDYEIDKKSLVQLWIAQGYIQPLSWNEHLEDIGDQYFEQLLSRSFFEVERYAYNNKEYYKMQNLIHDLARSIIASDVLVLTNDMIEVPKTLHILSFGQVNAMIEASKKNPTRTLFMLNEVDFDDDSKDDSILNKVIPSFNYLRVLSLNKFNIRKMPKFLGKLSHLRYLDLSNNDFKALPSSIARLKSLQTLKVIDCVNLKEFPKDTRELIHLRHLENDGCGNLTHMPCGIGDLTSLQSLPIFVVGNRGGYSRDRKIGKLSELKKLNDLRGELRIKNLENVWNAEEEYWEANLAEKQHIRSLRLEWRDPEAKDERCRAAESVMEGLRPHDQLEKLWIDGYKGEKFPSWMMNDDGLLLNLVHIVLSSCERCQILPPFAKLCALKSMWLSGLEEVEYMTECSSATPFFPSLETLQLDNMPKLKGLRKKGSSSEQDPSFPLLSKLDVGFCHELTSLTLHSSRSLSEASWTVYSSPPLSEASLTLHHCLNLKSLTLPSSPCRLELSIDTCCNLESLELPSSPRLSKLYINGCNDLKSLNLHSSPDLSQLTIRDCHSLTSLAQPPSPRLSQLEIRDCPNLTSFTLHSAPELSSLEIRDCPKLTSLKVPSLPCLEKLHLNTLNKEVLQQLTFVSASRHT